MKKSRKRSCAVNVGRWLSYAAAGAVTAMAATDDAQAVIAYSGIVNLPLDPPRGINPNPSIRVHSLSAPHQSIFSLIGAKVAGSHGAIRVGADTAASGHYSHSFVRFSQKHPAPYPGFVASLLPAGVKITAANIPGFATSAARSFSGADMLLASGSHGALPGAGGLGPPDSSPSSSSKTRQVRPQIYGWAQGEEHRRRPLETIMARSVTPTATMPISIPARRP